LNRQQEEYNRKLEALKHFAEQWREANRLREFGTGPERKCWTASCVSSRQIRDFAKIIGFNGLAKRRKVNSSILAWKNEPHRTRIGYRFAELFKKT
jgi:hypothetical protein